MYLPNGRYVFFLNTIFFLIFYLRFFSFLPLFFQQLGFLVFSLIFFPKLVMKLPTFHFFFFLIITNPGFFSVFHFSALNRYVSWGRYVQIFLYFIWISRNFTVLRFSFLFFRVYTYVCIFLRLGIKKKFVLFANLKFCF